MSHPVTQSVNYAHTTQASSPLTVFTGSGQLVGIFCASASSTPTIKVTDGAAIVVNTFTPVASTYYQIPACFNTSLIITISGTVDCTIFWGSSG